MKKLFILLLCFTLIVLSACNNDNIDTNNDNIIDTNTPNNDSTIDPTDNTTKPTNTNTSNTKENEIYSPVLDSWKKAIQENFGYSEETNVKPYPFICQSLPNEFSQAHYAYYDLDKNNIPELYIASFGDHYSYIADVYTIHEGKPVRLFSGVEDRGFWGRNDLDFSQDGKALIVTGSGGALYTDTFFYKIAPNGYQVEMLEGITTYNPDNLEDFNSYYHLPDGTYKIATNVEEIEKKYYGGNTYFSDFHEQLEWLPISP